MSVPVMLEGTNMLVNASPLFQSYLFADYSGAADSRAQMQAIKAAYAEADGAHQMIEKPLTRDGLVSETLRYLRTATAAGKRTCFGFDHQLSLPAGFLQEIGLSGMSWRQVVHALVVGHGLPPFQHPSTYACEFNDWCISKGQQPYFYSATKAARYGIPKTNPRAGCVDTIFRLTECCEGVFSRGKPKPFNRVGDNGTVGGQTIMGLIKLLELLHACEREGIPVKCWPFDGLAINSPVYANAHVLIEPYPAAVRPIGVAYTDVNDAIAAVRFVQQFDQEGNLADLLDLRGLADVHKDIVLIEGWIAGHLPPRAVPPTIT